MALPTIDETEALWITRTNDQGYHSIQEVFPNNDVDRVHRANCRVLVQMGKLQPEHADQLHFSQRRWNQRERYRRKTL